VFSAAIFDWDGTLANTKCMLIESFRKVLAEANCRVDDEFIERLIGTGPRNIIKESLRAGGITLSDQKLDEMIKRKIEIQLGMTWRVELFNGAVDLLNALYGKIRMALATMSHRPVIEKLLFEKRLMKYFDTVITVDEVEQPKPSPEVFLKCASTLGSQPSSSVVFEDSVFGVIAAKKAGMRCIAVSTGAYSMGELKNCGADLVVCSLAEIGKILNFIFS
jgi:HAD superfamily hydrolase (TIGR01509 family)